MFLLLNCVISFTPVFSGHQSFLCYVFLKYFLLLYGFLSIFLKIFIFIFLLVQRAEILILKKCRLSNVSFMILLLVSYMKNVCLTQEHEDFLLYFQLEFLFLGYTFMHIIHF